MNKAMRLTPAQLVDIKARIAGRPSVTAMRDSPAERQRRAQKYGNEKVLDKGITFDSKAEHKRWQYLALMERAKEIKDLRLQVSFELIPAQVSPSGKKERPTVYIADFVYRYKDNSTVVEDVKGAVTPEFRLKRKLMLYVHGIEVKEVRS